MEWMWLINLFFTIVLWNMADNIEPWTFGWLLALFASAVNGAVVMTHIF